MRKLIRLFVSSKILQSYWYKFIKTNKFEYSSTSFEGKLEHDGVTMFFIAEK